MAKVFLCKKGINIQNYLIKLFINIICGHLTGIIWSELLYNISVSKGLWNMENACLLRILIIVGSKKQITSSDFNSVIN